MGKLKDKMYESFVRKNDRVQYEYERYVMENIKEHYESHWKHLKILFKLKWHYQVKKEKTPLLYWDIPVSFTEIPEKSANHKVSNPVAAEKVFYYENDYKRPGVEAFLAKLMTYDVISFDIFDTLIYRKVEKPNDIFHLMSSEMGMNDFAYIRKRAETEARDRKEKAEGTREVVLSEIYDVLQENYHVDCKWMNREIALEVAMSMQNPYMHQVYHLLCRLSEETDKTIVFTTDMYLPLDVIKEMLQKNGYEVYHEIILSNEYGLRKGDGTLQSVLSEHYPNKTIIHIGDNKQADIDKTRECGMDALYNPDSHFIYKEPDLENMAGSFYRAVIQTTMNNGLWDKNMYYSHGYRVGGILAAGYCEFLNEIVKKRKIDKILFCSRDCDILYKIYNRFYRKTDTEYVQTSRYALFNITTERYLYDLSGRYIMRYLKMYQNSKTIETILKESGYGYLVDYLEESNLDRYQFPCAIKDEKKFHNFIWANAEKIREHNRNAVKAAEKYFSEIIGEAKNILVVDIGWSGTCISALKYFVETNLSQKQCQVYGALMCTNRDDALKNSIQFGDVEAYINTPFYNMDITRYIFPGPPKSRSVKVMDKLHMPVEYLFTSAEASLLSYGLSEEGEVAFSYSENAVLNSEQIAEMQSGMMDFVETFHEYTKECRVSFAIPPYTAFMPLKEAINHERYCYEIYKDFLYDAMMAPYSAERRSCFGELFDYHYLKLPEKENEDAKYRKRILFVSPEMIYSGAPRSLLRMCKVAVELGYVVTVWSAKNGPFMEEFQSIGIPVDIVSEKELDLEKNRLEIASYDMAVCNTIMTSEYAKVCCQYIPTVWYIREATNIPDFIVNNFEREYVLRNSLDIYCVSDYAKAAIEQFTKNPVHVIHNCVEDEAEMALPYHRISGDKIKFVQFGTMEYRKGYDVLLEAYLRMPKTYKDKSELYFAGGFINSGTPFCSYLFRKMQGIDGVHYLGLIKGEERKIQTLSQMDVVVVASRDESCSLVALEGAMLSKPLIVTENVGAKYMVNDSNGYVVKTADADSLSMAMMALIDKKEELAVMGKASRKMYEECAGMQSYTEAMRQLYALSGLKSKEEFKAIRDRNREIFGGAFKKNRQEDECEITDKLPEVIVSLTSHPGRIAMVHQTVRSLLEQTVSPYKIILWLSKEQFPRKEAELPGILVKMSQDAENFVIRWVDGDIKPHKKYYYAMQEFKDYPVIIVDDDAVYEKCLVERLLCSYVKFPDCISAMRANLMNFKRDGSFMDYSGWIMDYKVLLDIPSTQLVPVGVGGVLYPPNSLPAETFLEEAICRNCLFCDDLWLKIMASHNGYRTVVPKKFCTERLIEGSQDVALWKINVYGDNNDQSLRNILKYYDENLGSIEELMDWIHRDRFV